MTAPKVALLRRRAQATPGHLRLAIRASRHCAASATPWQQLSVHVMHEPTAPGGAAARRARFPAS